jgi:hypothetical protein
MNFKRWMAGLALSMAATSGCYGGADAGAVDETGATSEDVTSSRAWESLVGAWEGDTGAFHGLVFTATTQGAGRHWFSDADNGIRCVRAPCPSESRFEGVFTATTRTINLRSADPRLGVPVGVYGTYSYTLRSDVLTLTQGGRVVARLHKVTSYCADADDCGEQRLATPRCLGGWMCTAAHTCRYACARPAAGEGEMCGGIAGITCASGLNCVLDGTYPDAAGTCRPPLTRCATVRCTATTHCVDNGTSASCVPNGPSCAAIRCASGYVCRETDGVGACVQGIACGTSVCGTGTYCCNPLRSLCARMGVLCIQ